MSDAPVPRAFSYGLTINKRLRTDKKCPICGENGDIIGCDFDPLSNSYCVHYTGKGPHHTDIISLCQRAPDGQTMQDFYTPHESQLIGGWLIRAVLDFLSGEVFRTFKVRV